jgi:hypothetical protein
MSFVNGDEAAGAGLQTAAEMKLTAVNQTNLTAP